MPTPAERTIMTGLDLAYIAGAIDSDGYITAKRQTYGVRVRKDAKYPTFYERIGIKQTSPEIVDMINREYGGYRYSARPSAKNGKMLHAVELRNQKAAALIKDIFPFLRIKRRQAELAMQLRELMTRGVKERIVVEHMNRWGRKTQFTRYQVGERLLKEKERVFAELKQLNDTREDPAHQPKPWR
jgi:hypothetical protein